MLHSLLALVCVFFTATSLHAEEAKPKKKVIKTVTTYEEVDEPATEQTTKKSRRTETTTDEEPTVAATAGTSVHLDLLAGIAVPTGDIKEVLKSRFGYGVEFLFNASPDFHLGAFYSTNNGAIKDLEPAKMRLSFYGLVGQFYFNPNFFFQAKGGLSNIEARADDANGNTITIKAEKHPFILGGGFGANLPINQTISIAPIISFTHSFETGAGTDEQIDPYGLFEAMVALRFNF